MYFSLNSKLLNKKFSLTNNYIHAQHERDEEMRREHDRPQYSSSFRAKINK